jgi:hypothetical protein
VTEQWPAEGDLLNGRYRLIEPIGAGGMAVVWRARDESLERLVAVKVLNTDLAADRRARELVRREARTAAQLTHPQATPVYDYGEMSAPGERPAAYVVMQLLEGEPLDERLAAGPLPWPDAARIGEQVARVLAATHGRGVIHGDVSPGNVVLTPDGVRVIDFGIAETLVDTGRPGLGGLFGTPPYVAPERLAGEPTQLASDVYALGALLFEMLTGRPPHPAITWADADEAQRTDPPPSLVGVPHLPADVAKVCLRCLDPDPASRPDASEVADNLAAALAPRTVRPRPRPWPSQRRFVGACVVAAAAVLVATGVVANCWPQLVRPAHSHAVAGQDNSGAEKALPGSAGGPPGPPGATGPAGSTGSTAAAGPGGSEQTGPADSDGNPAAQTGTTATPAPNASSSAGHSADPGGPASGEVTTLSFTDAVNAVYAVIDSGTADGSITAQAADTLRAELRNLTANRTSNAAGAQQQVDNLRRKVSDGTRDRAITPAAAQSLSVALDNLAAAMQQEVAR